MIKSPCIFLSFFLIALDQWSKLYISSHFKLHETLEIIPSFFSLTLAHNYGVAFGVFTDYHPELRPWVIGATTCLALAVVFYLLRQEQFKGKLAQLALWSVVGGAIGNIIDRVRLGYVVDFLDFNFGTYHWPAFNVADSAICIGVCALLLLPSKKTQA